MSTGRLSRPSSAASHSSRLSHTSQTSKSSHSSSELKLECKAAYLSVFDDVHDLIPSMHDFVLVLQQAGRNPSQKVIQRYWDEDKGSMSFDEFADVCRKVPTTSEDDLMKAFSKIDINGDGYISLDELCKIMTTKGEKLSRQEVKTMIDEVDENKDGRLDYKEFCRMFASTTEECKKLSLRAMEKKERRRTRKEDVPVAAQRKDMEEGSVNGSQASIRTAASEKRSKISGSTTSVYSGSVRSLRSAHSIDNLSDDKRQSQVSVRSAARSGSRQSLLSIDDLPRPSPRGNKKCVIGRLSEPKGLREWHHGKSKGCFFVDEDKGFVSHQYQLVLTEDTDVWLTIQPIKIGSANDKELIDTALYILQDDKDDDDAFIAFTEQRDSRGCHGVRCKLSAGNYSLLPFTTGCRLRPRKIEPTRQAKLVSKSKQDKIELTKPFKSALLEIFEMSDLDGNNLLSREEFNWFNIRTSDEQVADDEWQVVEDTVNLEDGEITKEGFIALNNMEAQDNEGDPEDLWITLSNMGYNKALEMDEACPFLLDVYAEDGEVILKVTNLENPGKALDNAVCASAIAKGESRQVKSMKDLTMYTYIGDARATVVVENKSRTKVVMELDCSKSRNCVSDHGTFVSTLTVPAHSRKVGVHMLPEDERDEWSARCTETILK